MSILRHIKLNYETKTIEGKHELAEELIEYSLYRVFYEKHYKNFPMQYTENF